MSLRPFALLLTAALLSSAPAWGGEKKSVPKTVTGTLVSVKENGIGETYTIQTREGAKVLVDSAPVGGPLSAVKPGTQVVVNYTEDTELWVSAIRLVKGPKFKKKPESTVQGTFLEYEGGEIADSVFIENKNGEQEGYTADFGALTVEPGEYKGKKVELSLYTRRSTDYRGHKVLP